MRFSATMTLHQDVLMTAWEWLYAEKVRFQFLSKIVNRSEFVANLYKHIQKPISDGYQHKHNP